MIEHLNARHSSEPILQIAGLEHDLYDPRTGDSFRVEIPDFVVSESEFVAVTGPTGCGKSTLLSVAMLVRQPTQVDKFVITERRNGQAARHFDVQQLWHRGAQRKIEALRRQFLGFAPQRPDLIPSLTVAENVEIPLRLNQVGDYDQRVCELLLALSLPDAHGTPDLVRVAQNLPNRLSGGQAQRASIGRAVAHRPRLLFADEPTSNLDRKTAEHVLLFLDKMRFNEGTSIVIVSHDEALVRRFADRVIRMDVLEERLGGTVVERPGLAPRDLERPAVSAAIAVSS